MAFLEGKLKLKIYTDSTQTEFPTFNLPQVDEDFINDTVTGIQPLYLNLAASGTQAINFNGLTGITQFYIKSDAADITLAMNGLSPVTVKYGVPGYVPIALTSLSITNSSASVATNVTLILIKG
jgi:hypothetical protein